VANFLHDLVTELSAWLTLAAGCGLLILYVRVIRQGPQLLPPQRHRAVPWSGPEVCLVVLTYYFVVRLIAYGLLQSQILDAIYGVDFQSALGEAVAGAARNGDAAARAARDAASARLVFWAQGLALPIQAAAILLLLHSMSGTRPYQLGLTTQRWAANAYLGAKYWLIWTPVVEAVNILALYLFGTLAERNPDEHPIVRLFHVQPVWSDWILMVFLAVVAAPVLEELLFRGVLQPWFARRSWGGDAALAAALFFALFPQAEAIHEAIVEADLGELAWRLAPAVFVLALVPGSLYIERLGDRFFPRSKPTSGPTPRNLSRAWYGTAALFAAVHSNVWPSPIPLFVLALVLGWLAYRTQSLVGPILLHALFNGVACLVLIFSQGTAAPENEKGRQDTSAVARPPAVSTSTTVPGSWLPRRR
jgi:membrane protease YdiL (CAAX protease family)